jgi:hypothetical protein
LDNIPLTALLEGAAIPLAALTAALGLYARLRLPEPWLPASEGQKTPLVIYGASSAVGSYALQYAVKSNIHPIITIAGRAQAHVEKFIDRSKGDTIIDYRSGDEAVVKGIKERPEAAARFRRRLREGLCREPGTGPRPSGRYHLCTAWQGVQGLRRDRQPYLHPGR